MKIINGHNFSVKNDHFHTMNLQVNIEALQSYLVQDRTIRFIIDAVQEALNQSEDFGATIEIERLRFGTQQPSISLTSLKDVDVTLQWHLQTHDVVIPSLKRLGFDAPFQAVISVNCQSDCSIITKATLAYNKISPGCVRFPLKAIVSDVSFNGKLTIQYFGDALIVFFESPPEFNFGLELILGASEKLFDQTQVRDFLCEGFHKWIADHMLHPNALKFPFARDDTEEVTVINSQL